jgi:hypothetical protein
MRMPRFAYLGVFGVLAALLLVVLPARANAAEAGVRWFVTQGAYPTTLAPGSSPESGITTSIDAIPEYLIVLKNVGAGGASPPITVTQKLPEGITPDPTNLPGWKTAGGSGPFKPCEVIVAENEVVCTIEEPVVTGGAVPISVPIEVSETAPTPAVSRVEVTGDGATAFDSLSTIVGTQTPSFELLSGSHGLTGLATAESGQDAGLAGSHPYTVIMEAGFASRKSIGAVIFPTQNPEQIEFRLPRGLVVNPQASTRLCTEAELVSVTKSAVGVYGCPAASQVGRIVIMSDASGVGPLTLALYDLKPPPGVAAELGFNILGAVVHIQGGVDGSFRLDASSSNILAKFAVMGVQAYLWGDPADPRHDAERRGNGGCGEGGCALGPGEANTVPLITMPTSCGEPLSLDATARAWEGGTTEAESDFIDEAGNPLTMEGCNALAFEPTIESKATTDAAESPSGLEFQIHQPQDESLEGRATAALKDARVTLPEGVTLNASAANGLGSCTEAQMGYDPELEPGKFRFTTEPQSCPNSAKVGTLEATSPLLKDEVVPGEKVAHVLPGSIYVAKPFDNPFESLLAIYLAVEDEQSGVVAKLAGKVEPDPTTGRLTATFEENPELPLEDIQLHFFAGEHAALTTPLTCGTHTTTSTLTPWSTPEGIDVYPTSSFQTTTGCSGSEAQAPKTASFTAGTQSPLSGSYSPFILRLSRPDGSQHITGIETTLPEGLLGKLAGVSYCPESGIAQARSREEPEKGKEEITSPSCPSSSEVGTVDVTAGSGISPIPVSGHAYLAGSYKGAPLSLVVIVPAVAGPFDLGTVVDRVALNVGEYDARIHAVADPLPTIRDGIPLDVRSIELKLDRPDFTLNPTSCEAMAIEGSVTTQPGQTAAVSNRFQVGECGHLAFKPKLSLSLKGATKRTGHPALKAVVTYPRKGAYANIARAQVSLPHSEFIDQGNIAKACTRPVLAARECPAKSIYGKVKAWSPLLERPLEGPVYLVGGYGYKLPALVAELNGQIRVLLVGKIDTDKQHGIRNTFEAVPDAPVEKFVLEMKGGKSYGLLENSEDVCKKKQVAGASFRAQNGKTLTLAPTISNSCKGRSKKSPKKKHKKH